MSDQLPFSKERQVAGVGRKCPTTGTYKGTCTCNPCRGRRNRRKGQAGQRTARKALGLTSERWRGREANEESWTAALRLEVKTGGRMANPIGIRYDQMRDQSEASKAIGDARPFAAVVKPDDWTDVLIVVKGSDLPAFVAALLEEWSG